jgi:predicted PurR-regulated permease PerM
MATKLYDKLKFGFPMTHVENTYLKQVEQDRQTLNSTLAELKQVFSQLSNEDLTPDSLNKTISNLQGSAGELDNTRRAVIALTATTVVFVATTVYMFLRKPSQYL